MFALDPTALDRAATRVGAALSSLTCLDLGRPLRDAASALPGSATAAACEWTAADVDAALDAWVSHVLDLSDTASLVARDAATTDHDVASSLRWAEP